MQRKSKKKLLDITKKKNNNLDELASTFYSLYSENVLIWLKNLSSVFIYLHRKNTIYLHVVCKY